LAGPPFRHTDESPLHLGKSYNYVVVYGDQTSKGHRAINTQSVSFGKNPVCTCIHSNITNRKIQSLL
jgi:hypothetical protein